MKILVGWWNPSTTQLVDIPGFDHVEHPSKWIPAFVDYQGYTTSMGRDIEGDAEAYAWWKSQQ